MENIKPLPERVRSSVRSGFIISDMIRVVEELVYNSLDAGATKVLVSVGVGTGYVKVEDNGCGISRDGLALLGERYATSKNHTFTDTSTVLRSFGSHGEVLCSIADVSLLEIITKAKGRPNGYRKIMKGSKCLYLGIDDDRCDTGTTVIVRDMFYNQPVRRTHMQTSPKKVLHSIKKCALQIALVRPQVSFSIVDIESEDELLRTCASSSPLALLISHFGIKVTLLHELNLSEGPFELAGYISSSPESFSAKGIQYIYVNSRFIDRSPVHKLLNGLASTCWEQLDNNQSGKRNRPQACATYCLNLTCPQFLYDLNVEQLKTSVEFKDWLPVLSLIEKSVTSLWRSIVFNGKMLNFIANPTSKHHTRKKPDIITSTRIDADFLNTDEIPNKRCRFQNDESSQPIRNDTLFPMVTGTPEISQSSYFHSSEGVTRKSIGEHRDDLFWMCPSRPYNHSADCSYPVMDCTCKVPWDNTHKLTTGSEDRYTYPIGRDRSSIHDCFSSDKMVESPVRIMANYARNKAEMSPGCLLPFQFEDDMKPFRRNYSLPESGKCTLFSKSTSLENLRDVSFNNKERFGFQGHHHETDGEYIDPRGNELAGIDSELIPSQENFTKDLYSNRKCSRFLEDQVSSQKLDVYPRMVIASPRSNEADPSLRKYQPSRFQDGNELFLRDSSSFINKDEFIGEKWSVFQSDYRVQRFDSMKVHGVNENADEVQRTMWLDDESYSFPFNESKAESARSESPRFCDQYYAAAGDDNCHSVQEFGGFNGEYIDPHGNELGAFAGINSELIPSQEDFMEDLYSTRKCNRFLEDQVSSKEMDQYPIMLVASPRSNEADPSIRTYLPARFQDGNGLFLRNCSSFKNKNEFLGEKWTESVDAMKLHGVDENFDEFQRTRCQDDWAIPIPINKSKDESARFKVPRLCDQDYAPAGDDKCHSVQEFGGFDSTFGSSDDECEDMILDSFFGVNSWNFEHQSLEDQGVNCRSRNDANFKYLKHKKKDLDSCDFDDMFNYEDGLSKCHSYSHSRNGWERGDRDTDDSYLFGHHNSGKPSASQGNILDREADFTCPETYKGFSLSSSAYTNPSIHIERVPKIYKPRSDINHGDVDKARRKRSQSAPPIYKGKRRVLSLNATFTSEVANPDKRSPTGRCKIKKEKLVQKSSTQCDQFPETSPIKGFPLCTGRKVKEAVKMQNVTKIQKGKKLDSPSHAYDVANSRVKWRNGCPQAGSDNLHNFHLISQKSMNCQGKYPILDVSSGILHLASDTIVPKSISRKCLEASKVLVQVDKKFIPVVSGKILAVIDQHAADERIRLEELRKKVFSGEMKTVAYLQEEKEMILPENVHQLLHYYADKIKHWGWICNIFQDSQSFTKNLNLLIKQPGTSIRLIAVPCILGVKLSDTDLLEFVEQLADTDGSSTVPPSVVRVLNYKACRGAIMFGDKLLPSECSLIVEELKKTSLCFQCAHGRPTIAPLVNLEALRKQIEKLGLCNKNSSKPWHGLRKQPISLKRAKQRLGMD